MSLLFLLKQHPGHLSDPSQEPGSSDALRIKKPQSEDAACPRNLKNAEMVLTDLLPEYLTAIQNAWLVNNCTGRGVVYRSLVSVIDADFHVKKNPTRFQLPPGSAVI